MEMNFKMPDTLRLLVVEDEDTDYLVLKKKILANSIQKVELQRVKQVSDIEKAISSGPFDLIFLDLSLPDSPKEKTIETIKDLAQDCPVIVITGDLDQSIYKDSILSGSYDCIEKNDSNSAQLHRTITNTIYRRWLEENREELHKKLERSQRMDALGRLTAGIAHDFNNKLAIIFGYASALNKDAYPDEVRVKARRIVSAADTAAQLTKKLLAFGKELDVDQAKLDLSESIKDSIELVKSEIERTVPIKMELADKLSPILFDTTHLDQIIVNLIFNSRDALVDSETEDPQIKVKTYVEEGQVKLSVSDNGPGMTKDLQKKVFMPYFTTKDKNKGTGLGLSVVYGVINQNKAKIELISSPGNGANFIISFQAA